MSLIISPSQPIDGDLTSIAELAGTSGFLKKTAANSWSLDTSISSVGAVGGVGTFTKVTASTEAQGTISSGTIDLTTGNYFEQSISANTTYTFSKPPVSGTPYAFTLKLYGTSAATITWPTSVKWKDSAAPNSPAVNTNSLYVFITSDGGTTWYGVLAGENIA